MDEVNNKCYQYDKATKAWVDHTASMFEARTSPVIVQLDEDRFWIAGDNYEQQQLGY